MALWSMSRRSWSWSKEVSRTDGSGRFEFQVEPSGQDYTITAIYANGLDMSKRFRVPLNEDLILSVRVGSPDWDAKKARSKFAKARGFGENRNGKIMLTDHGDEVWYRNVKVLELNKKT